MSRVSRMSIFKISKRCPGFSRVLKITICKIENRCPGAGTIELVDCLITFAAAHFLNPSLSGFHNWLFWKSFYVHKNIYHWRNWMILTQFLPFCYQSRNQSYQRVVFFAASDKMNLFTIAFSFFSWYLFWIVFCDEIILNFLE